MRHAARETFAFVYGEHVAHYYHNVVIRHITLFNPALITRATRVRLAFAKTSATRRYTLRFLQSVFYSSTSARVCVPYADYVHEIFRSFLSCDRFHA